MTVSIDNFTNYANEMANRKHLHPLGKTASPLGKRLSLCNGGIGVGNHFIISNNRRATSLAISIVSATVLPWATKP